MFDTFTLSHQPGATRVASVEEAQQKSKTRYCWILHEYNNYEDFDLLWEPSPWEAKQIHVWPSQHQDNGGTYLVPKDNNGEINYHLEVIQRDTAPLIVFLDHGNGKVFDPNRQSYNMQNARFINDYLGTLKRVVKRNSKATHLWVTSSVCNYANFQFSWHPSEWQNHMLHVFPSNEQEFGDTFYINVKNFLEQCDSLELLEWYDTICFQDRSFPRQMPPLYLHSEDTQVDAVKSVLFSKIEDPDSFNDPVTLFTNTSLINEGLTPTINLWRPETRAIIPLDHSGERVLIPREALIDIKDELYDYPRIDKSHRDTYRSTPMDIVFMSNGEECAEENYKHLCESASGYRIHWVKDVEGRVESAREAARVSVTDWFFSVNAKLKVDKDFPWDWQPDRLQRSKHYIFYAHNPFTDDTYGHMATILWNKKLVNTDTDYGLDFTMSHEHEVIPILSGEAVYGPKEWDLWRTAFREVIKLLADDSNESAEHLAKWLTAGDKWTSIGAKDADQYYEQVSGDMDKLKLTFEWDWLAKYFYVGYIGYE